MYSEEKLILFDSRSGSDDLAEADMAGSGRLPDINAEPLLIACRVGVSSFLVKSSSSCVVAVISSSGTERKEPEVREERRDDMPWWRALGFAGGGMDRLAR